MSGLSSKRTPPVPAMLGTLADGSNTPRRVRMPAQKPGSSEQDVETPPEFLAAVRARFGLLAWDLAASRDNVCSLWIGEKQDSLVQDWHLLSPGNHWLWCNPPYGDIEPWATKASKEAAKGARILMLTPAATGTAWYRELLRTGFVLELAPRIKFVGHKQGFPKDLALTVWEHGLVGRGFWRWDKEAR